MLLSSNFILQETKSYSDLKIGDILKRKLDDCFYEIKNISYDAERKNHIYIFHGFAIKHFSNLQNHFFSEKGIFDIYK
jgi:hypothetical protein